MDQAAHRRRQSGSRFAWNFAVLVLLFGVSSQPAKGQKAAESDEPYSRRNTWSVFGEFSPNSHHIVLGVSEERRIISLGGEYQRRLVFRRWFELEYLIQARPVFLERDPALAGFRSAATGQVVLRFQPAQRVDLVDRRQFTLLPQNVRADPFYETQWTYAFGLNPIGFKWSFVPRRRLQPVMTFATGFVASARDVPVDQSRSFNFTFELGFGVEYYLRPKRSLRLDYRVHHLSNAYTGFNNPGIDSNLFQLSYSFGR